MVEPDKVKVNNKKELSSEEKKEVEEAVKASNPKAKTVTVKENGDVEIEYEDGSKNNLSGEKTVIEKENKDLGAKTPEEKVEVKELGKLTKAEQEKVREAIIRANPELQLSTENITVDEQGNTVITKDGKTTKISGKDLVFENVVTYEIGNINTTVNSNPNPNTGDSSIFSSIATLVTAAAAFVGIKKKKD